MTRARGFTLVEVLVALVVFATMAALAYGGLRSVARTRSELAQKEDAFRDLVRTVDLLNRDLGETVVRPVRGSSGQPLAAFIGAPDHIEFTRLGFANPQAEQRSNLERVLYEFDDQVLKRGRFAVLDRANDTQPQIADTHVAVAALRFRFLSSAGQWLEVWPPPAQKTIRHSSCRARCNGICRRKITVSSRMSSSSSRHGRRASETDAGADAMRHQRGVALLIALLVVALATILIAGLLDRGGLTAARTRNALREAQAENYAKGLEDYAARVLTQDSRNDDSKDTSPTSGPYRCRRRPCPAATSPRR